MARQSVGHRPGGSQSSSGSEGEEEEPPSPKEHGFEIRNAGTITPPVVCSSYAGGSTTFSRSEDRPPNPKYRYETSLGSGSLQPELPTPPTSARAEADAVLLSKQWAVGENNSEEPGPSLRANEKGRTSKSHTTNEVPMELKAASYGRESGLIDPSLDSLSLDDILGLLQKTVEAFHVNPIIERNKMTQNTNDLTSMPQTLAVGDNTSAFGPDVSPPTATGNATSNAVTRFLDNTALSAISGAGSHPGFGAPVADGAFTHADDISRGYQLDKKIPGCAVTTSAAKGSHHEPVLEGSGITPQQGSDMSMNSAPSEKGKSIVIEQLNSPAWSNGRDSSVISTGPPSSSETPSVDPSIDPPARQRGGGRRGRGRGRKQLDVSASNDAPFEPRSGGSGRASLQSEVSTVDSKPSSSTRRRNRRGGPKVSKVTVSAGRGGGQIYDASTGTRRRVERGDKI